MRKPRTTRSKSIAMDITNLHVPLNPDKEPLTLEKLKQFPGHDHLSEQQLMDLLHQIKALASILLECVSMTQPTISKEGDISESENFSKKAA